MFSMYKYNISSYAMMKFISGLENNKKLFFNYHIVYFYRSKIRFDEVDNIW
jgi:hypothetical protein